MYVDEFVEVGFNGLPTFQPAGLSRKGSTNSPCSLPGPHGTCTLTNFIDNPVLNMLSVKNHIDCVWISPATGQQLNVQNGDEVILETNPKYMPELPRPVKAKVFMSSRITRDDCVMLFHGIGHRSKWLKHGVWGYRDGDLIPQKDRTSANSDPTGMGWS